MYRPPPYMILFITLLSAVLAPLLGQAALVTQGIQAILGTAPPGVVLGDPGSPSVSVALSPSSTSSGLVVLASSSQQLLYNPDFYDSPDGWLCSPGANLSCYWLLSDTGASGGVAAIGGTLPSLSEDVAYILQEVRLPDAGIREAILEARVRLASGVVGLSYYIIGVYDPGNSILYYSSGILQGSYTNVSVNVTSYLEPGGRYYVVVGLYSVSLRSYTVAMHVDWARLYVSFNESVYGGIVLTLNATETVYASLQLVGLDSPGGLDVEVTLYNMTNTSSPLVIRESAVIAGLTSVLELSPSPAGYSSGYINLTTSKTQGNHTMQLVLKYCMQPLELGICVYYNITILVDPPGPRHSPGTIAPANATGVVTPLRGLQVIEVSRSGPG